MPELENMEDPQNTLYAMLEDEPRGFGEKFKGNKKIKMYLRISVNGELQHDVPATRINGLKGKTLLFVSSSNRVKVCKIN